MLNKIKQFALLLALSTALFAPFAHAAKLAPFPNSKSLQPLPPDSAPNISGNVDFSGDQSGTAAKLPDQDQNNSDQQSTGQQPDSTQNFTDTQDQQATDQNTSGNNGSFVHQHSLILIAIVLFAIIIICGLWLMSIKREQKK